MRHLPGKHFPSHVGEGFRALDMAQPLTNFR